MPELPEVETIKNQLKEILPFRIKEITSSKHLPQLLKLEEFSLKNLTIRDISRYGKVLIFHLGEHHFLLSHLGMSGSWRISTNAIYEKHKHLELINEKNYLTYVDPRRFGFLYIVGLKKKDEILSKLGMDVSTAGFTHNYLYNVLLEHPHRKIKPLLLEQSLFAGIGNYMANEICAHAGIRPMRLCHKIGKTESIKLYKAIIKVTQLSIKSRGVTFHGGYKDTHGEQGKGVLNLVVFHQPICMLCKKTKVKIILLNQRGTYYCPTCQK